MEQASPFISLILAAIVIMGSPGPSTISLTAVGAAFGHRRSLPYLLGLILGTTAVLLIVAAGLSALASAAPMAAPVLLVASGIYIAYLAYQIASAPPLAAHRRQLAEEPRGQLCWRGVGALHHVFYEPPGL